MADKAADGQPYGQFGKAVYDPEDQQWHIERSQELQHVLRPVGTAQTLAKPTTDTAKHLRSTGDASRRREKQIKALSQFVPDVQPASGLLPDLARVSEAVEEAATRHDARKGALIALGKIYDESRRSYVYAIAYPCGPTGSDLRIVQGLERRQGWEDDRASWIETPDFAGEAATWQGTGVSVLSVTFAQPIEKGERYLAVRLQNDTLIFRPVLRKHAHTGSSRLDPNLLFSLGSDETGDHPHADIAFNPWFTGQLAIVDQVGQWSVWETGRKSLSVKNVKTGSLHNESTARNRALVDDGWARIACMESILSICIASRRKLVLIDLDAAAEIASTEVDVGLEKGLGWILDIRTVQNHLGHLFVLTSTKILLLHVARNSSGEFVTRTISKFRHHRNPEDISMRMSLCSTDNIIFLILRSAFHSSSIQYFFDPSDQDSLRAQLPNEFTLAGATEAHDLLDIHISPAPFVGSAGNGLDATSYYHVYLFDKNFGLSRMLYAVQESHRQSEPLKPLTWVMTVSKARKKYKALFGGFIVDQDDDDAISVCKQPVSRYIQRRHDQTVSRADQDWTISYERIVRRLNEPVAADLTDIEDVIEEAHGILQKRTHENVGSIRSLWDVTGSSVDVKDVQGASERLDRLTDVRPEERIIKADVDDEDELAQPKALKLFSVVPTNARRILGLGALGSLAGALDAISQTWKAQSQCALEQSVAERREMLATLMAAEVTFASQALRIEEARPDPESGTQSKRQAWDLPVRPQPIENWSQSANPGYYEPPSRSQTPALPTPSASASTITSSSRPANITAPEVARLSNYTTFSKDAPSALPRTLNKVLSHWTPGANPAEYDWQVASRTVRRHDEEADEEEMTEKERRQVQRRAERHLRRQRREAEESQRMHMLSSQAPELLSFSQPAAQAQRPGYRKVESQASAGAGAPVGSSQSYGLSQIAASQVVPGRHGGRPPARKKRKSGF